MRDHRITDPDEIDCQEVDKELKDGKHVIIQFSHKNYSARILSQLNELCNLYDRNFGIRFYGTSSHKFDFKTLLHLPNVKCLYVDCLTKAENVELLIELRNLEKLSLGIYELRETEVLGFPNLKGLKELIVGETKTKAVNLTYLKDYHNLNNLLIASHTKNIDAIGELTKLESLSLNSIKKTSFDFINNLSALKSLNYTWGERKY